MGVYISLLFALLGLFLYLSDKITNERLKTIGLVTYGAGLLAFLMATATRMLSLFGPQ